MNENRMRDIINNAIEWAINVSEQHTRDLINAMGLTKSELLDLGWDKESLNFIDEIDDE